MKVEQLLEGNDTLFKTSISGMAEKVEKRLNEYEAQNLEVLQIHALPDYHNWGRKEGGIKDILFYVTPRTTNFRISEWKVKPLRGHGTMHGVETPDIVQELQEKIDEMGRDGLVVRFMIMIADHHKYWSTFEGRGGKDGLKDILLCYFKI